MTHMKHCGLSDACKSPQWDWELKKEPNITRPIRFLPRCDSCLPKDQVIITGPFALWHGHPPLFRKAHNQSLPLSLSLSFSEYVCVCACVPCHLGKPAYIVYQTDIREMGHHTCRWRGGETQRQNFTESDSQ